MKKVILLMLLLLGIISFASCEKKNEPDPPTTPIIVGDLFFTYNSARDAYDVAVNPASRATVTEITVPDIFEGKPVNLISDFSYCIELKRIALPDCVLYISDGAFLNCSELCEINLPESLIYVGRDVFVGCAALIKAENGASYVDNWLVSCDPDFDSITVREGTFGFVRDAFANGNVTSLFLPATLRRLGNLAYTLGERPLLDTLTVSAENPIYHSTENCLIETETSTLVRGNRTGFIPAYIKIIGEFAFKGSDFEAITLPHGVTTIDAYAFHNCRKLRAVSLPDTLTVIGDCAFYDCVNLWNINFPENLSTISHMAFYRCAVLKTVILPDSVNTIEDAAFYDCTGLRTIVIPATIRHVSPSIFHNQQNLAIYYCGTDTLHLPIVNPPRLYYYKAEKPTENHKSYWHYVDGVPTVWHQYD